MIKSAAFALLLSAAVPVFAQTAPAAVPVVAVKGKMLLGAGGARLAPVNRIAADGSPQIILEGKMVTIPIGTLAMVDGKLTTSLSKREASALQ